MGKVGLPGGFGFRIRCTFYELEGLKYLVIRKDSSLGFSASLIGVANTQYSS